MFVVVNPSKFFGEKAFLRENLNCHILGIEGRKKLKFSEDRVQICQNFLKENRAKNVQPECPLTFGSIMRINHEISSGVHVTFLK